MEIDKDKQNNKLFTIVNKTGKPLITSVNENEFPYSYFIVCDNGTKIKKHTIKNYKEHLRLLTSLLLSNKTLVLKNDFADINHPYQFIKIKSINISDELCWLEKNPYKIHSIYDIIKCVTDDLVSWCDRFNFIYSNMTDNYMCRLSIKYLDLITNKEYSVYRSLTHNFFEKFKILKYEISSSDLIPEYIIPKK